MASPVPSTEPLKVRTWSNPQQLVGTKLDDRYKLKRVLGAGGMGAVFFGEAYAGDVARGLLMLESNWDGPVLENRMIEETLRHWQRLALRGGEGLQANSRFQMYLARAYLDASVQRKKALEVGLEAEAYRALGRARTDGVKVAVESARRALARVVRAKGGRRESDFVRLFDRHRPLQRAILKLARGT